MRARLEGAVALLGSATPSLESAYNAQRGRYEHLRLPRRIFDRPMAAVEIVDMRKEYTAHGADVILSDTLAARIASASSGRSDAYCFSTAVGSRP